MAMINDVNFSDIYITPGKHAYMWSRKTPYGLKEVMFDDYDEFLSVVEKGYKNVPHNGKP